MLSMNYIKRILNIIKNHISKNKYNRIGIFGIAFKDGSM